LEQYEDLKNTTLSREESKDEVHHFLFNSTDETSPLAKFEHPWAGWQGWLIVDPPAPKLVI